MRECLGRPLIQHTAPRYHYQQDISIAGGVIIIKPEAIHQWTEATYTFVWETSDSSMCLSRLQETTIQ